MLALAAIVGLVSVVGGYQARDVRYLCSVGDVWSQYEKLHWLGRGAHATVYEARSKKTGTVVAVKEFSLWDYSVYQEAIREVDFMQRHRHPNLRRSFDCFYEPRARDVQVVMDLMEGNLRDAFSSDMPEREISRILRGVLQALRYMHSFSLIHRDVRAHNVLIGRDGVVKLSDFTLVVQASSSGPTDECCHPNFRAPEVTEHERFRWSWSRKVQTTAVDIWAVGLVAVEMINGDYPNRYSSVGHRAFFIFSDECCHPNFRAPEVTEHERFRWSWSRKVQTTAVDIWAVGLVAVEMINGDYPNRYSSYSGEQYADDTIRSLRRRISPEFEDFIRECLQHVVSKRPTAATLLQHKFIRA